MVSSGKIGEGGHTAAHRDGIPSTEHFVRYNDITEVSMTILCCTQTSSRHDDSVDENVRNRRRKRSVGTRSPIVINIIIIIVLVS